MRQSGRFGLSLGEFIGIAVVVWVIVAALLSRLSGESSWFTMAVAGAAAIWAMVVNPGLAMKWAGGGFVLGLLTAPLLLWMEPGAWQGWSLVRWIAGSTLFFATMVPLVWWKHQ